MKKNILIVTLLLLTLVSFNHKPIVSCFVQRITATSGTIVYDQSTDDIYLLFDNAATIASITIPFPTSPINGQKFGISARAAITSLTMTSSSGVSSGMTSLAITTGRAEWIYCAACTRWFRIG